MKIGVLIPTFRRPIDLRRCLTAVSQQAVAASQVIVVTRKGDTETQLVIADFAGRIPLRSVIVDQPGVVHALNSGISAVTTEITAITDDDSQPPNDWLARIQEHFFRHPNGGGFGGRDIVIRPDGSRIIGQAAEVGVIRWYGRIIGNHHIGTGGSRAVDVLKGVNCSFRSNLLKELGIERGLLGSGAQTHWELVLCRRIRQKNLSLVYDPTNIVMHYVGERFDNDQRTNYDEISYFNNAYNEFFALCSSQSRTKRILYLSWLFLIGHSASPGVAYTLGLALIRRDRQAARKFALAARAKIQALAAVA